VQPARRQKAFCFPRMCSKESGESNGRILFNLSLARARYGAGKEETEGRRGDARGEEGRRRNHGGEQKTIAKPLTSQEVIEAVPIPLLLRTKEFIEQWTDWIEHRLECGRAYGWPTTFRCFRKTMIRLETMGLERAIAAIDYSLAQCYRGIYEQPSLQKDHPRWAKFLNQQPREQKIVPRL